MCEERRWVPYGSDLHTYTPATPIERPNPLERLVAAFAGASAKRRGAEAILAPVEGALHVPARLRRDRGGISVL